MEWSLGWRPPAEVNLASHYSLPGCWIPCSSLTGHSDSIAVGKFSPDGSKVATAGADGRLIAYDLSTGQQVENLLACKKGLNDVCWDSDSRYLLGATTGGVIKLFGLGSNGKAIFERRAHQVATMALSTPTSGFPFFSSVGADGFLKNWDARRAEPFSMVKAHSAPVTAVEYSNDNKLILTAGLDGVARLWTATELAASASFALRGEEPLTHACFSPNSRYIVLTGKNPQARGVICLSPRLNLPLPPPAGEAVPKTSNFGAVSCSWRGYVLSPVGFSFRIWAGSSALYLGSVMAGGPLSCVQPYPSDEVGLLLSTGNHPKCTTTIWGYRNR